MAFTELPDFQRRQLRTTIILALIIAALIGGYFGIPSLMKHFEPASVSNDVDAAVQAALANYAGRTADDLTPVAARTLDESEQKLQLVFEGVADSATTRAVLDMLAQREIKATFFISGLDTFNRAEAITMIMNAGHTIGIVGYSSAQVLAGLSAEAAVADITRASDTVALNTGIIPTLLMTEDTPGETLQAAAFAAYIKKIIVPSATVLPDGLSSQQEADALVAQTDRGAFICVKITDSLDKMELVTEEATMATVAPAARDMDRDALVQTVGYLAESIYQSDYARIAQRLLADNGGALADAQERVYTTERAVCFTFADLGNEAELTYLMEKLDDISARALFFITQSELTECPERVGQILSHGHDLGLAVNQMAATTSSEYLMSLLKMQDDLRADFHYSDVVTLRPLAGEATDALREAASADGLHLISSLTNMVQDANAADTDATAVYDSMFGTNDNALQRGNIVHFRMNFFTQSNTLLGDLAVELHTRRNVYAVRSLNKVICSADYVYKYPVADEDILPAVKDKIYPGQLAGGDFDYITSHYIGIRWVNNAATLPGFSKSEIKKMDKTGLLKNADNAIFLSFDDWGTDRNMTRLLDVLNKHNVKATFFVATGNVPNNPNLLRAIALGGHAIACHTNGHTKLSNTSGADKNGDSVYTTLTDAEAALLQADLVEAYDVLQHTVGDMTVDGKIALTRLFRPPTLAISKIGLETVFNCGYTYSISGSTTTQDYMATDAQTLAKLLYDDTKPGAVFVMHMSDNSIYTAEALDLYFTRLENEGSPYKFARIDDYAK